MEGLSQFMWGIFFGIIGLGFFSYGKKQKAIVPLVVGVALFVIPYFISNVYALVIVGAILVVLPYYVEI